MSAAPPIDEQLFVTAREEERFLGRDTRGLWRGRSLFIAILAFVLFVHAAVLVYLLYRDSQTDMTTPQIEETPIELVPPPELEMPKPPPPPPPPPQPKQEPPKPKEEIEKPAFSAPRAPNEQKVDTNQTQEKTQAPKAATPPRDGAPAPAKEAAPKPAQEASPDKPQEALAKPEEEKPDAEALDKATQPKKKTTAKDTKAAPKSKNTVSAEVMRQLSGSSNLQDFSFAKPTPKAPVYGGTEDVRYLAIVEGMIMQRVHTLPRLNHYQEGGAVAVYFHIDDSGRVISMEILKKSGNPSIDSMAMDAVRQASPFPTPPRGIPHGLVWGSSIDGQLPLRVMR